MMVPPKVPEGMPDDEFFDGDGATPVASATRASGLRLVHPPDSPIADPFAWLGTSEIFAPLPETKWVVRDLKICPGRPSMIAGYGHSMKTLAAQSMALACTAGRLGWEHFKTKPMRVDHLDQDQGKATLLRYQRLGIGHGIARDELEDRLRVSLFPSVYLNGDGAEETYARAFEKTDLVILDALRGATPGLDENDSKIRFCLDTLTRVSERTGTAFIVLHHAGKPKEGHADVRTVLRGSSAIFDACGCVLVLAGQRDEPKLVHQAKTPADSRGGGTEDFYLAVEDVAVGTDALAGVRVVFQGREQVAPPERPGDRFDDVKRSIVDAVKSNPGLTSANAISERVQGTSRPTKLQAIKELLEEGRLVRPEGERGAFRVR